MHSTLDIPYILAIPLLAAGLHFDRLMLQSGITRQRLEINQVKPLLQAQEIIYPRASAVLPVLADRYQWSKGYAVHNGLDLIVKHGAVTAYALYYLRNATGIPQAFMNERAGDLITSTVNNHSIQDALLPYLESFSIFTGPIMFELLSGFCVYQAFKLASTTQTWRGWRQEHVDALPEVKYVAGLGSRPWVMRNENGLITVIPAWLANINFINQTGIINWLSQNMNLKTNPGYMLLVLSMIMTPALTLHSLLNPAQLYYIAASLTLARVRSWIARLHEKRQEAKWERINQKWEPLTPKYRLKSRSR